MFFQFFIIHKNVNEDNIKKFEFETMILKMMFIHLFSQPRTDDRFSYFTIKTKKKQI